MLVQLLHRGVLPLSLYFSLSWQFEIHEFNIFVGYVFLDNKSLLHHSLTVSQPIYHKGSPGSIFSPDEIKLIIIAQRTDRCRQWYNKVYWGRGIIN